MSEYRPPYTTPAIGAETNVLAVISLIAGVLGWLGLFGMGGIVAVICGHIAKSQIHNSNGAMIGDGLATAGLVLGYLNLVLTITALCLGILMFAGVISGAAICPFIFGNYQ